MRVLEGRIKKRITPVRDGTWRIDNGKVIGDDSYGYNSHNRHQQNVKFENKKFSSVNTELNFFIIFYLRMSKILCHNSTKSDYLKLY